MGEPAIDETAPNTVTPLRVATWVGGISALFATGLAADALTGHSKGWQSTQLVVAAAAVVEVLLLRWAGPWPLVWRRLWVWTSVVAAGIAPLFLFPEHLRPGALSTVETLIHGAAMGIVFLGTWLLGKAVQHPSAAFKAVGIGVAAVVAIWGATAVFEALSVKALLGIIVVLLVLQLGR